MISRYQAHNFEIPEETVEVVQAAFPKGDVYMTMRDRLGPLFNDSDFAPYGLYLLTSLASTL
jgi:transposase